MTSRSDGIRVLSRALDQTGDVLTRVHADQLAEPSPCSEWSVGRLLDHLVAAPQHFVQLMNGEQPDWSAAPEHLDAGWAELFRERADDLIHAWHQLADQDAPADPDWQTAEFAVHTWDLVTALGRPTKALDPEVAERGLEFMRANLSDDNRGGAFAAEQPAPDGADAYQRLAAFAGRQVQP